MKCIDCVYFGFDIMFGRIVDICTHTQRYIPPTGYANEEHECEFFNEKSGISKWDSYTDEEKEEVLKEFDEKYHGNDETFDGVRETYTFEEAKEMFIEHLKEIDKNRK